MFSELNIFQQAPLVVILLLNGLSFGLFYLDKQKAKMNSNNRVSEKTLLTSAYVLGGIGALLGMSIVRHKTQHTKFKVLVPIAAVITLVVIILVVGDVNLVMNFFR